MSFDSVVSCLSQELYDERDAKQRINIIDKYISLQPLTIYTLGALFVINNIGLIILFHESYIAYMFYNTCPFGCPTNELTTELRAILYKNYVTTSIMILLYTIIMVLQLIASFILFDNQSNLWILIRERRKLVQYCQRFVELV